MTEPVQPTDAPESTPAPDGLSPYRSSLMEAVQKAQQAPNLVEQVYMSVGLTPPPNTTTQDAQVSVGDLKPGDLVGWHGGTQDESYQGNLAVYAGDRHIIEPYFQTRRRRPIGADENVFGIPVVMQEDTPTEMGPMGVS